MKNKKAKSKKKVEWEGFDDCAICQAMKTGQAGTYDGLMKAFDEQNFKNGHMALRVQNKNDLYYDAMDLVNASDFSKAEELLLKAKEMDPDYVQTYVGFVSAYSREKDKAKREKCIKIGYEKTLKLFPKWPRRLEWGFLENRAYLRAIGYMADLYWDHGDYDKAEELFRLVLKLNPEDNQGVRYEIAAMLAGLNGPDLNKMFDEGDRKQDWCKLERLVSIQNKKFKFWKEPRWL
jgi:tetratricopeptide (TPR) repeat protein